MAASGLLPADTAVLRLSPHADDRGTFTELFRRSWDTRVEPVQWNVVSSGANVLRGVHAHWRHWDYLSVVSGTATVGLCDLRQESPTCGLSTLVELQGSAPCALVIPASVAHGFYFHTPSIHVYAVSHEWDLDDELGCRWDDPALGLDWPCSTPQLSERDRELGSLDELRRALALSAASAGGGA